jgi:hypothetical protein
MMQSDEELSPAASQKPSQDFNAATLQQHNQSFSGKENNNGQQSHKNNNTFGASSSGAGDDNSIFRQQTAPQTPSGGKSKIAVEVDNEDVFNPIMVDYDSDTTEHEFGDQDRPLEQPHNLAFSPVQAPEGDSLLRCTVVRNNRNLNRIEPYYDFYVEGQGLPVMRAKKRIKQFGCNFHFFDIRGAQMGEDKMEELNKHSERYIGKLRSRDKNKYTIYHKYEKGAVVKPELGAVLVTQEDNLPVRTFVTIPTVSNSGSEMTIDPHYPQNEEDTLKERTSHFLRGGASSLDQSRTQLLANEQPTPRYDNEGNVQFTMKFGGRVKVASVKNFKLKSPDDGKLVFQFGKTDDRSFILDFAAPFSAFSAFATAITHFEMKAI